MSYKILVAIDKSEIGQHVFDEAVSLAKALSADLRLLHVLNPFEQPYVYPIALPPTLLYPMLPTENAANYPESWQALEREGMEFLTSLRNQALASGVTCDMTQHLGDPSRMICDFARSWNADLIIMGRRGCSKLSEFFLGSVSNYVTHHAPCSILIVQGHVPTEVPQQAQTTSA
ncbi:MAG: universal stress protein [Scytonema sp. RU_4_4]|nr:universal stress protein [Scytonema sp. RU_4_4]NJR75248.1 universal stress protein [Scytonema sp. CRU_2_7]